MPPFAGEQDTTAAMQIANDPLVDLRALEKTADVPPAMTEPTEEDKKAEEEAQSTSICDIFNPCSGGAASSTTAEAQADGCDGGFPNPLPSHVFKTRKCAECGSKISKFSGYVKEVVASGTPDQALFDEDESQSGAGCEPPAKKFHKVYYQKGCYKIKQFRDEHKKTFPLVLDELMEHFAEIARLKAAEEEALRRLKEEEEAERLRALEEEETSSVHSITKSKLKSLKKSLSMKSFKKSFKKKDKSASTTSTSSSKRSSSKSLKSPFSSMKARRSQKKRMAADDGGEKSPDGKWKRYYDANHERYYYSDGVTTSWTEPEAFKEAPKPQDISVDTDADSLQ